MQSEKTPLSNVFRALHELVDPLVRDPLPQGWVELLRRLDEKDGRHPNSPRNLLRVSIRPSASLCKTLVENHCVREPARRRCVLASSRRSAYKALVLIGGAAGTAWPAPKFEAPRCLVD